MVFHLYFRLLTAGTFLKPKKNDFLKQAGIRTLKSLVNTLMD
jgi:hypothetical protein